MMDTDTVTRAELIRKLVYDCNLSYPQATQVYECLISVFEDVICSGKRLNIGQVCAIVPVWREPREIKMGFKKEKGGVVKKVNRTFYIDGRLAFKVVVHKKFFSEHQIRWPR